MTATARTSKKRRIKAGTPIAAKKKTTPLRRASKVSRPRAVRRKKAVRRSRPSSSANQPSFFGQLLSKVLALLIGLAILTALIYSMVIPRWLFSDPYPRNILLVPGNIEEPSDLLLFAHIDQDEKKQQLNLLDGMEMVNVVGGYGEYQLQNVYPLLRLDGRDDQYVEAAFNHALGVAVDEVIPLPALASEVMEGGSPGWFFLEQAKDNPQHLKELLQFHYLARQVSTIAPISLSQFSSSAFQYQTLGAQTARDCPVAVINTTSSSGLASDISRIIEDNGGLVVRVTNEHAAFTKSSIYVAEDIEETCRPLISLVSRIFPTALQQIPATQSMTGEYRAKLILFLGSDSAEALGQQP